MIPSVTQIVLCSSFQLKSSCKVSSTCLSISNLTNNLCRQLAANQGSPDSGNSSKPDACKRVHGSKELVFCQVLTMKRDDDSHSMSNPKFQVLSLAKSSSAERWRFFTLWFIFGCLDVPIVSPNLCVINIDPVWKSGSP